MGIPERETLAFEGVVVVAVDLVRPKGTAAAAAYSAVSGDGVGAAAPGGLTCRARVTTRGMWTDNGRLLDVLHTVRGSAWWSRSLGSRQLRLSQRLVGCWARSSPDFLASSSHTARGACMMMMQGRVGTILSGNALPWVS